MLEFSFRLMYFILSESHTSEYFFAVLIQEISREINTIGSKTSSNYVINNIIIMKDEVEKIREQIQNIL